MRNLSLTLWRDSVTESLGAFSKKIGLNKK